MVQGHFPMSNYELLEAALADTNRLLYYRLHSDLEIHLNIKGFDYAWILDSIDWHSNLRVLDVGAGYSPFPLYIANTYGCEVWAVDDFSLLEQGNFWERNRDPQEYIASHPEISYVVGRIGSQELDELPEGYFDIIYSASALEHVPAIDIGLVWKHMDRLLKPQGHMLHGLDIAFPTSRGLPHVALSVLFDLFYPFILSPLRRRFAYETPKSYLRTVLRAVQVSKRCKPRNLGVLNMIINSEIVTEPIEHTYHRMVKDGLTEARYYRMGSLLLHLKKIQ
jgi:ubiquinone/menaquinone biosynthesis C-methylase UbiE